MHEQSAFLEREREEQTSASLLCCCLTFRLSLDYWGSLPDDLGVLLEMLKTNPRFEIHSKLLRDNVFTKCA